MKNEKKFYDMLNDVFIGAKIEGEGGFVNLMRIKSNYYKKISEKLKKDIETRLKGYEDFKEDLFLHLYNFFDRYFTKSGSIYFDRTAYHKSVYERVYTDERDVILFWKTHMLYYVKTDRIFKSLPIEFDDLKFYFDASKIVSKKANEKRSLIFSYKEKKGDGTNVFIVEYSERGKITKEVELLKKLNKLGIKITEEQLERAFRIFEKQSEVDFFINKNAKEFLREQFKLWQFQYMFDEKDVWKERRIKELQILKETTYDIIDYVSQFEDELVMVWNKPKFVRKSNYVVTLDILADKLGGMKVIKKIIKHISFKEQIKEWKELGIINDKFKLNDIFSNELSGEKLAKRFDKLPIDTKYFKDIELDIIGLFDNLDKSLDGWLIKSENYQALNTIINKFKGQVQTTYIDPPFNLDSSDQFLYRTNYKDSNWATLLENRIRLSKDFLNEKGSMFVRCDHNGNWIVRCLMDLIFGEDNFRNEIIINKSIRIKTKGSKFPTWHDSFYFYAKNESGSFFRHITKKRKLEEWRSIDTEGESWEIVPDSLLKLLSKKNLKKNSEGNFITRARIILGNEILPREGRRFPSQKSIVEMEKQGRIRLSENNNPQMPKPSKIYLTDNWSDIYGYSSTFDFSTENSELGIMRCIESTSNVSDFVLDFFLGSGTTTAVAQKTGRKWLGIEMGEHFYSVVLPRMKKVLAYDKGGISKEIKDYKGGGFFKYYELEQYEEALKNCKYEDGNVFERLGEKPYNEYVFMKDKKLLDAIEIDYNKNKVKVDLSKLYDNIDVAETLSNLTGKWIKKIYENEVEFEDGEKINIKELDYKLIKPLIWWEK